MRKLLLFSFVFSVFFLSIAFADHSIIPSMDPVYQKASGLGISLGATVNNDITSQNRIMVVTSYAPSGYTITSCNPLSGWRIGNSNSRYCSWITNGASISPGGSETFGINVSTPSNEGYYDWTFDTIDDAWQMDSKTFTTMIDSNPPNAVILLPTPSKWVGPNMPFDVFVDAEELGIIKSGLWNTGFIVFKSGPYNMLIGTLDFSGTPERGMYSGKSFYSGSGPVYFLPGAPEGMGELEITLADSVMNYKVVSVPIGFSNNISGSSTKTSIK